MTSKYWIKLYHEIIDDPKMGRLPDRLWRRSVEVFLLAGEIGIDGKLPNLTDMSWRLRISEEELESDLVEMAKIGIVSQSQGTWAVTNFAKRQSAASSTERWRRWRDRQRKEEYYTDDQQSSNGLQAVRLTDTDTDVDTDTESDTEQHHVVAALKKVGVDPEMISEIVDNFEPEAILERIRQYEYADRKGIAQTIGYLIDSITKNWKPPRGYKPDATSERERRKFLDGDL